MGQAIPIYGWVAESLPGLVLNSYHVCCPDIAGAAILGQNPTGVVGGDFKALGYGFPAAAAFLLGELEDALRGDAGYSRFAVGEPALLAGGEAAEAALALGTVILGAVAVVVGVGVVIDLAFGPGVGLVEGAVEGFAAVGGEGFEDAGSEFVIGVGYGGIGLPVGAVPRGEAGGCGGVNVELMCGMGVVRIRRGRWCG